MKKYILLISLLPVFCFGQNISNEKSITILGISEMEIEPDLITISMTAKETENIKKESDMVSAENKLLNFINSLGIAKDNFSIDRFSAREQSTISGTTKFKQSKTYKLVIPKAALLDTIVAKCFEVGMENIFVSRIDHSGIDSLRAVLLSKALLSAKRKADLIAKDMGIGLGNVTLVNESYKIVGDRADFYDNRSYNLEDVYITAYGSGRSNAVRTGSTINLEKLHLSKTVIVRYEIK